jgi:hypothetical protein
MVQVGLTVVLGDVHQGPETPGVGSHPDRCTKHQGAKVIRGGTPTSPLRGAGLRPSMASGLDGVTDVANLVERWGTLRRKVMPSLLARLGTLGPRPVRAVAGDVVVASSSQWGVSVGAVPIGSGRHLGRPGARGTAPGG